ncbi:hypothetical protein FA95DRAFT_1563279 [Auriscalpium vulgare]|uniref:Uncharacterized protein n=1 Tax=Auriscalpium vulgare TaxID=40419 RepID=A0ACB8RHG8_9AGAM|nr:hypothetical protein FA95DRAFT_1563279 [Auriscalpium vulgare]
MAMGALEHGLSLCLQPLSPRPPLTLYGLYVRFPDVRGDAAVTWRFARNVVARL